MCFTRWQWYYKKTEHTKIHISYKITHHAKKNAADKAAQRIKDTLHTMNITQQNKATRLTGRGDL
jgi:hypothetical protein